MYLFIYFCPHKCRLLKVLSRTGLNISVFHALTWMSETWGFLNTFEAWSTVMWLVPDCHMISAPTHPKWRTFSKLLVKIQINLSAWFQMNMKSIAFSRSVSIYYESLYIFGQMCTLKVNESSLVCRTHSRKKRVSDRIAAVKALKIQHAWHLAPNV